MDGIRQDLSGASSLLTQVRVVHPVVATMIGAYVGYLGLTKARPGRHQKIGLMLASIVGAQVFAGIANIVLLTPLWMQLLHLALADGLWIMFILFAVEASISDREVAPV
jgi:cytochrome c oxidase assembly protein subunit 15